MYRLVLALAVAPLAAPIVFFLAFRAAGEESELSLWDFFVLFGIPAYLVAAILGLPLAVVFRALSLRSFWLHVAAGFLLGGAAGHAAPRSPRSPRSSTSPRAAAGL